MRVFFIGEKAARELLVVGMESDVMLAGRVFFNTPACSCGTVIDGRGGVALDTRCLAESASRGRR